jgi:hypothetical protein
MRVLEVGPRTSVVISCRVTLTLNESLGDVAANAVLLPMRMRALKWLSAAPLDGVREGACGRVGRGEAGEGRRCSWLRLEGGAEGALEREKDEQSSQTHSCSLARKESPNCCRQRETSRRVEPLALRHSLSRKRFRDSAEEQQQQP